MIDKIPNQRQNHYLAGIGNRVAEVDENGLETASKQLITGKISDVTAISLLTTDSNWNSAGAYTGTAIPDTYEGQYYSDSNYYYYAYSDNSWIRILRTSDTALGTMISKATEKTTPVDADMVGLMDSAASNILKKLSWANIKATLKSYFDTLYKATFTENTAFNKNFETSTANIKMNGSTSLGTSENLPRVDHIHPSDTAKASLAGAAFTGPVTNSSYISTTGGLRLMYTAQNGDIPPSSYPEGISYMAIGSSDSGWPLTYMDVITHKYDSSRIYQLAVYTFSPYHTYFRHKGSGDTWSGWMLWSTGEYSKYAGERIFDVVHFTAAANRAVDLRIPNTNIAGTIEVEVVGYYINEQGYGVIKKSFGIGTSPGGTITTNKSIVNVCIGDIKDKIAIGELSWDATNSVFKIPISHLSALLNTYRIRVKWNTVYELDFNSFSLSSEYSLTYLKRNRVLPVLPKDIQSTASTSTFTYDCDLYDAGKITAQTVALTMGAPTGTPYDMQTLVMYIKDAGISVGITWNAAYRSFAATLPITTVADKWCSMVFMYNSTDTKWDLMSIVNQV